MNKFISGTHPYFETGHMAKSCAIRTFEAAPMKAQIKNKKSKTTCGNVQNTKVGLPSNEEKRTAHETPPYKDNPRVHIRHVIKLVNSVIW